MFAHGMSHLPSPPRKIAACIESIYVDTVVSVEYSTHGKEASSPSETLQLCVDVHQTRPDPGPPSTAKTSTETVMKPHVTRIIYRSSIFNIMYV